VNFSKGQTAPRKILDLGVGIAVLHPDSSSPKFADCERHYSAVIEHGGFWAMPSRPSHRVRA
jgi:hypothetical protein